MRRRRAGKRGRRSMSSLREFKQRWNILQNWDGAARKAQGTGARHSLRLTAQPCPYERTLVSKLIEGLHAIRGAWIFGIIDAKRFDERCSTLSLRLGEHNPTEIAAFLGERGIFTWDGNFYALNLSERLGVQQKGGVLRIVHYNTADEVNRLLAVLREFAE